jgi:hypothetical protein
MRRASARARRPRRRRYAWEDRGAVLADVNGLSFVEYLWRVKRAPQCWVRPPGGNQVCLEIDRHYIARRPTGYVSMAYAACTLRGLRWYMARWPAERLENWLMSAYVAPAPANNTLRRYACTRASIAELAEHYGECRYFCDCGPEPCSCGCKICRDALFRVRLGLEP